MHKLVVKSLAILSTLAGMMIIPDFCSAESVIPKGIGYTFSTGDNDPEVKACRMKMFTENSPEPENLIFEYFMLKNNLSGKITVGFSIDVNDVTYENGSPKKLTKVPLTKANFESKGFSSAGRLNGGTDGLGGIVMGTIDGHAGGQLIGSISAGVYSINFNREDMEETRVYNINSKPSQSESNQFDSCIANLLGGK